MHSKIKAMVEEGVNWIEIVNTILEEIDLADIDRAALGEVQAFIDLSHEVRSFCYNRRGIS